MGEGNNMMMKPTNYIWTSRQIDRKSGFGLGSFADTQATAEQCKEIALRWCMHQGDAVGSVQRPSCSCTGFPFLP